MNARSANTKVMSALAVVFLLGVAAHAQAVELRIHVTLEDDSGIPGALVVVRDGDGNQLATGVSNEQGRAVFQSIPAGAVKVEITLEGFEDYRRELQIEPGDPVDLTAVLRTQVLREEIVVTGKVEVQGSTGVSLSDPDGAGTSRFCAVSPAYDNVAFGSYTADRSLVIDHNVAITFPSNCVMNRAGTRAWVGNRVENRIWFYDRFGSDWTPGGEVLLDGQGLGHIALSPTEDRLLASQIGSVEILGTTPTGFEKLRSLALASVRQMAALDGLAYATTDVGVYSFSFVGNDPPLLLDGVDGAFSLAPVSDDAAIVTLEDEWRFFQQSQAPVRLGGITSTPGDIVNARIGVSYAGTRSTEPILIWADRNQAKIGRMTLRPNVPDDVGGLEIHVSEITLGDFELTAGLPAPESLAANSAGTVLATFPFQDELVAFDADLGSGCRPTPTRACTLGDRFELEIDWRDFEGQTGPARVVPGGSEDSELFYFFSPNNWEMLVKTLDGCAINGHFWVFAAATTNVEYTLKVTDTETGATSDYTNPLGVAADAITDTQAFECSPDRKARYLAATESRPPAVSAPVTVAASGENCTDTETELCLNDSRYEVEVEWRDFGDQTGSGKVAPLRSADSGLLWFFSSNNWEMLVKVLDGCGINDNVWVFSAATTNVEYTLRVTDTETGMMREYFNPLGQAAAAITDTEAFSCSP